MRACAWVLSLHAPYRHRLHCLSSLSAFISQALVFKAQVVLELTIESSCAVLDVLLLQLPRVFVRAPFGCQLEASVPGIAGAHPTGWPQRDYSPEGHMENEHPTEWPLHN